MYRFLLVESKKLWRRTSRSLRAALEELEPLVLLSFSDGNGPVVTASPRRRGASNWSSPSTGHLNPGPARTWRIIRSRRPRPNPELVTRSGAGIRIISASYSDTSSSQVTLTLKNSLKPGVFYRVFINGTPASMSVNPASNPLTDINGVLFDGDNDDTPGGDFLWSVRRRNEGVVHGLDRRPCLAGGQGRRHGQRLARARRRHRSTERRRRRCGEQHALRLGRSRGKGSTGRSTSGR